MISYALLLPVLVSFFVALFMLPLWIRRAKEEGLVGKDIHKPHGEEVAEGGGITVVAGFLLGVLLYIAIKTFYFKTTLDTLEILALLCLVLIATIVGLMDTILGWKRGLSRRLRIFLILFAAIPLMVINAGENIMSLPFFGQVDFGILYPLLLIPLGIVGATTTFNFLAGYNGLEAGQGIILLSAMSLVAFLTGISWLALIGLCMVAALLAFIIFNFYPARVFPGDALTYSVGSLLAAMAILGNFEKIAVFFFIPYIIEVVLKVRGKLVKQSYGVLQKDGTLKPRYDQIYGVEHLAIYLLNKSGIKATEKKVVYSIWIFQLLIILLGFIIFRDGIFI